MTSHGKHGGRPYPSPEAGMIGPEICLADIDMIEAVLGQECAQRKISTTGDEALHMERMIRYAFSVGMKSAPELQVFIRNISD